MLDRATFAEVIKNTPLIALDLIVRDAEGRALVGLRRNQPAKGYWFTPGGRIYKNERLDDAFRRISQQELGVALERSQARLLGLYEHIYDDNVFNADFGTHYVVNGYEVQLDAALVPEAFAAQHHDARWMTVEELLASAEVHENTKAYFR